MNFVIDLGVLITFTVGLTQAIKVAIQSDKFNRYVPLVSLLIGVGLTIGDIGFAREAVYYGIMVGLSASGLYSGTKSLAGME